MLRRSTCVQIFLYITLLLPGINQPIQMLFSTCFGFPEILLNIIENLSAIRDKIVLESTKYLHILFYYTSRARSLRNLLVSGNECGRVFPAGVGPGSPSRDAANWLPSRFSLSVETRRRYGWLRMMVFPGARLFPSPNLVPFGRVAARERQGALSRRAW